MSELHNSLRQVMGTGHRLNRRAMLKGAAVAGIALSPWARTRGSAATPIDGAMGHAREGLLIDPAALQARVESSSPVVVGFMPPQDFAEGHIPGSVQLDWPELELATTSSESIAEWEASIASILGALGITPDVDVVAYDNGTLFASRLWWILHYLGHERCQMLDGGLDAWVAAGAEVADGEARPSPAGPYRGNSMPAALAQLDEVLDVLEREDVAIVDARTGEEFADGHIPGAVNINYPLNAADTPPHRWRPHKDLVALYEDKGVTPDKLVIPYCSSGVRSAVTAFSLHLIGFDQVALYTGSWNEWGNHPDTPKATGTS